MTDIAIFGASRGLGAALAQGVPEPGERVWCVSRTRPDIIDRSDGIRREWIQHDLADPSQFGSLIGRLADTPLSLLIYNAGTWESDGFMRATDAEIRTIVETNITSLLLTVRHLTANLRKAKHAKIILIGSTCGLENEGTSSVAYAATKFAVRGVAHSMRALLRSDRIPVTVISPGSMATDIALDEGVERACVAHDGKRIPMSDVVAIICSLRRLSPVACVKEIDLPALADTDV